MPALGEVDLLLREPAEEPEGALVLSHGRGTDERDLYPLLDELDPDRRLLGVSAGAPFTGIPPGGRHWYVVERVGFPDRETFARSYPLLGGRLDALLGERGIPWSRTVLGGFSQGAVMSYALGLGPDRPVPAALIALSGFIPEVEGWHPELGGREAMRVLIHHGSADPIIGVEHGRAAAAALEGGGLDVDYLETEVPHALSPQAVEAARTLVGGLLAEPGSERLEPLSTPDPERQADRPETE